MSRWSWRTATDRIVALIAVIVLWPTFLLVALLIEATAGKPVLLVDNVISPEGQSFRSYRFRTTGPGTPAFSVIGRLLRRWRIDESPALWSVVLGTIDLRTVMRELRNR